MKKKACAVVEQIIAALSLVAKAKALALKSKTRAIKTRIVIFSLLWNKKLVMNSISHKLHALLGQHQHDHHDQKAHYAAHHDSESVDHESADHEEDDDHQDQSRGKGKDKGKGAFVVHNSTRSNMNTISSNIINDAMSDGFHHHQPVFTVNPSYSTHDYMTDEPKDQSDVHGTPKSHDDIDHDYLVEAGDAEEYPDLTHSLFDSDDQFGSVIDIVKNSKQVAGQEFSLEDEIDHVADLFIRRFHRRIIIQKQNSFKRHQQEEMLIHTGACRRI